MKLKKETIEILKNFANINNSIVIRKTKEGEQTTTVRVLSADQSAIAEVVLNEVFPNDAYIYDMNKLLGLIGAIGFEKHDVDFTTNEALVSDSTAKVKARVTYADPSVIPTLDKSANLPTPDIEFTLTADMLKQLTDFSSMLELPDIRLETKNAKLMISAQNPKIKNSNSFELEVMPLTNETTNINVLFDKSTFKFIPGSYSVSTSMQGISKFESIEIPSLVYYIPHKIEA